MVVYGFGERKAVEAFRNACNRLIYVENLEGTGVEKDGAGDSPAASQSKKEPPSKAVKIIARAIEGADEDGWANLGGVGSRIQGANSDFDARTYGCRILSEVVEKSGEFEIRKEQGVVYVRRKTRSRKKSGSAKGAGI